MKRGDVIGTVFFVCLFLGILILSYIVIHPFITALLAGALLAYIAYPLYRKFQSWIGSRSLAALIVSVLVIFIISVPTVLVMSQLTQQAQSIYLQTKEQLNDDIVSPDCADDVVCKLIVKGQGFLESDFAQEYIGDYAQTSVKYLTNRLASALINLPNVLLMIALAIFTMYYLLKDGKDLFFRITDASPLKKHHRELLVTNFSEMTGAIVYGTLVIALAQGVLATVAYWIAGVDAFLMWGLITTFAALIPFIGAWFVWFPISIFMAGAGYLSGDTGMMLSAGFLFLFGMLVISTIDNVLKPYLVAGKARVHPLLVFFGVIGGLLAFGFIGILIGPVLLGLLQTLFLIYEKELKR